MLREQTSYEVYRKHLVFGLESFIVISSSRNKTFCRRWSTVENKYKISCGLVAGTRFKNTLCFNNDCSFQKHLVFQPCQYCRVLSRPGRLFKVNKEISCGLVYRSTHDHFIYSQSILVDPFISYRPKRNLFSTLLLTCLFQNHCNLCRYHAKGVASPNLVRNPFVFSRVATKSCDVLSCNYRCTSKRTNNSWVSDPGLRSGNIKSCRVYFPNQETSQTRSCTEREKGFVAKRSTVENKMMRSWVER